MNGVAVLEGSANENEINARLSKAGLNPDGKQATTNEHTSSLHSSMYEGQHLNNDIELADGEPDE